MTLMQRSQAKKISPVARLQRRPAAATSPKKHNNGAPTPSAIAVRFVDAAKSYGPVQAVNNLSLDINAGQFVALLGPSGCGKTTLLNLVAGFAAPDRGDIFINGRSVRGVPPHERGVGVVFQDYALFPHMSVAENLAFPLEVRGMQRAEIKARVETALNLVRLDDLGGRRPDQLSGGQQQRVALGRALIYEPPILLLDEPFGALDRRLRDSMQLELKALHRRLGITFVFVTHDQDEAMTMADMVVVMQAGQIQQQGAPMALYDRPRTSFVAGFLGDCNLIKGHVTTAGIQHAASGVLLHRSVDGISNQIGLAKAVALRPELIGVLSPHGRVRPDQSVVKGRVVQLRFLGREVMLEVETELGVLLVRLHRAGGESAPELNSTLRLGWDAKTTVPLED